MLNNGAKWYNFSPPRWSFIAPPLTADDRGGGLYLRELLRRCEQNAPTRPELAELLEVSLNTVAGWTEGCGQEMSICAESVIFSLLAFRTWTHEIFRAACASTMECQTYARKLSRQVGRDTVNEAADAFVRFASRAYVELSNLGDPSTGDEVTTAILFLFVDGARVWPELLSVLADQESDPLWEIELISAALPWESRIIYAMKVLRDTRSVAQLAKERHGIPTEFSESVLGDALRWALAGPAVGLPRKLDPDMHYYRVSGDAQFSAANRLIQFEQARALGDYRTALTHIRRAVELQPQNAQYHFLLGATLGMVGEVEEGIKECWIADNLNPDDELPRVEVGIILLNADRNEEARNHLEKIAVGDDSLSAHLSFNLGVARFRCGAYEEAMKSLDRSISLRGDYGLALDIAAQCAFELGQTAKGRDLAKRARRPRRDRSLR